jgi:hypothetical protein
VEGEGGRPRRRVGREIALSLGFAAVFGTAFGVYVWRSMPSREQMGSGLVAPDAGERRSDLVDAEAVARTFVDHIAADRLPAAYAMMARAYRAMASLQTFATTWRSTPLLAGTRGVRLISTTRGITAPMEGVRRAVATSTARGHLLTRAGALDVQFTFLDEDGERRVLALLVAGVPVLQGVAIPAAVP